MRPGVVGISLVGTRRPGRQRKRMAAAPVSRAQPKNRAISIVVCALGQGRLWEGLSARQSLRDWRRESSNRERGPAGGAGVSPAEDPQRRTTGPRVRAEERFRSDAKGHPAVARTRGGRRQDPRPDSKNRAINSTVTGHSPSLRATGAARARPDQRCTSSLWACARRCR